MIQVFAKFIAKSKLYAEPDGGQKRRWNRYLQAHRGCLHSCGVARGLSVFEEKGEGFENGETVSAVTSILA